MWLDGFNIGNKLWKTYSFRELDLYNDPKDAMDLSHSRTFFEEKENKDMEFMKPRKLPLKFLSFPEGFCSSSSDMVFQVTGKWQSLLLSARPPIVQFHVNKTTDLFVWEFKYEKKGNSLYEIWSKSNKVNNTNLVLNLTEMENDPIPTDFNLTISCKNFPVFHVKLNFWDPTGDINGIPRDETKWDTDLTVDANVNPDTTDYILVDGAMEVNSFHIPKNTLSCYNFRLIMLDLLKKNVCHLHHQD